MGVLTYKPIRRETEKRVPVYDWLSGSKWKEIIQQIENMKNLKAQSTNKCLNAIFLHNNAQLDFCLASNNENTSKSLLNFSPSIPISMTSVIT